MKKVIITGADGFVGSQTVRYFINNNVDVLAIDISDIPNRIVPDGFRLKYLNCDIFNTEDLIKNIPEKQYDTFVHFAWKGSAGNERCDYNLQMKNALNTVECMKIAKRLGCTRFVCAGSIMEYEVEAAVHTQESRPGMGYVYGMAKHVAHCLCKSVAVEIGIELVWPMITNAYGPGEYSPRFVNTTLRKIIKHEPLQFTAATQNYDFVYITDVARAFYQISKYGKPFCEYIIGSSNAKPLKEFILEMQAMCAPNVIPSFGEVPFTGTNLPLSVFDTNDTEVDCGFKAIISFGEGCKRTMEWLESLD